MRSWKDESLLRRPPQEDSRRHRARHAQSSSGPHLRREPLLGPKRYARRVRQGDSLTPRKSPGRPRKADEKARALLEKDVEERPSATVSERRRFLEHITGTDMSDSTVRRLMKRLGFSQKTDCGGAGTRRVAKSSLESDGR